MPLSGKMLKKREQAKDAANGIVRDALVQRKIATAKPDVNCTICGTAFKVTKKNVDSRQHADSKHPTKTFAECFPQILVYEAEAVKEETSAAAKKTTTTKKKDDTSALFAEGLASGPKKVAGKR